MNIDGLIRRAVRMLMRRGVNKGLNMAANRGKDPADMTPAERQEAKQSRQNMQRARRGANIARRFMR